MRRRWPKCDKVKNRGLSARVRQLEAKSCLCRNEKLDDDLAPESELIEIVAQDRKALILSPKASTQIVEIPEVQDIEIAIFLERVLSLFGRVINKLELAAALPNLLADPEITRILTAPEVKIVRRAFDQKNTPRESCQLLADAETSSTSLQSFDENDNSSESTCNADEASAKVYEALQILNKYAAVREKIKSSRRKIAPQCHLFLQHMKYFDEHCALRIRSTPIQEKLREMHFRKLWHENHRAQQDIAALMRFLEAQRSNHHNITKVIESQYKKDFDNVERLNRKCAEDMKSTINRSERNQIFEHKSSEMRQNDLTQYLGISKNKLENLRATNLRLEQEIRSKRFKVSSQLSALIGKFDTEVGERYNLLEQLTNEFESDKARKEQLEEEMSKQLEIYNSFLEERQRVVFEIFRDRYEKFVRTRAAKIIQRWWRPIFRRLKLKAKKNKKKSRKKKKAK